MVGADDGAIGCLPEHADAAAKRPTARMTRAAALKM
jgi:hypothetical protein